MTELNELRAASGVHINSMDGSISIGTSLFKFMGYNIFSNTLYNSASLELRQLNLSANVYTVTRVNSSGFSNENRTDQVPTSGMIITASARTH